MATRTATQLSSDDAPIGVGKELWTRIQEHDISGLAAELAYRFLFALFPFVLFLTALAAFIAGAVGVQDPTGQIMAGLGDNLPAELADTIRPQLQQVVGERRPDLATVGALLALWAATSGTMTVIKAMNRAYGIPETRGLVRRYALGIGLTIAGSIGLLASFVTIVGGALLTEQLVARLGIGPEAWSLISLLRWPLVFALLVVGVAILYRVGPNMRPPWRAAIAGAVVFALGWLLATFGFSVYVANVADYGATYGALGGVIVLLLWLYLTGLILLLGAEIVAMVTRRIAPERLAERQDATGAALEGTREAAGRAAQGLRETAEHGDGERSSRTG
jgi:membrane protein